MAMTLPDPKDSPWVLRTEVDRLIRERDEAREAHAAALQMCDSWVREVAGRDSDIERLERERDELRALLAECREWVDVWGHGEDRFCNGVDKLLARLDAALGGCDE